MKRCPFYMHLYSKSNTVDVDLNDLLSGYNIPKLNESGSFLWRNTMRIKHIKFRLTSELRVRFHANTNNWLKPSLPQLFFY